MDIMYENFSGQIEIDTDALIVSAWNAYVEADFTLGEEEGNNKIFLNNKEYFENSFKTPYDAAIAVASGNWSWTDDFVYFDDKGYLVSFSHWDEETCPIDIEKINIDYLFDGLEKLKKKQKKEQDNNISRVIHDALE